MKKIYFITGIGTDVGKTVVSAIVTEALRSDYWKPIQAGLSPSTDSETVKSLISNTQTKIHAEQFRLNAAMSPHAAAALENITIRCNDFSLPKTENALVIEGAGGLLVPLNESETVADLILHFNAEVILVSSIYLGSINHALLTIEALRQRNIPIAGLIFNGKKNESSETIILHKTGLPVLLRIEQEEEFTPEIISHYAGLFNR